MSQQTFKKLRIVAGVAGLIVVFALAYQNCGQLGDSGLPAAMVATNPSSSQNPPTQSAYAQAVLGDNPSYYWRLDSNTTVLKDVINQNAATVSGSFQLGVSGALANDSDSAFETTATTFNVSTSLKVSSPANFSYEAWFKTTTAGGVLIGFGDHQTDDSAVYDLQLFMSNTGNVNLGLFTTAATQITSPGSYNDGQWHHVVGTYTYGSAPKLYVDGSLVVTGSNINAGSFTGYIHLASDACSGWNNSPTSCAYVGDLDEVAIYPTELTAAQILNHYKVGKGL